MSWRVTAAARRFAIDGELDAAIRSALAQATTPAAQQSVRTTAEVVRVLVREAPGDCDVYVRLSGHRDDVGVGDVQVYFAVRAHVNPGEAFNPEAPADTPAA